MNGRVLLFFFLLISWVSRAQKFPFELWHEGKLALESGDTLRGQIKYNMQDDLVQFQSGNHLETFTARKILTFEIFDATVKRYRQFYSLPYALTGQYKAPIFFELLEEGRLSVVCREVLEVRVYSSFYAYGTYTRQVLVEKYYYLKDDGTIQPLGSKKSDFLEVMGSKAGVVSDYIKEHKLDFDNKYDVGEAVAYYNSLFK